ncbi:hypothetical protein SLS62_006033 [Diatrype stigma]|uniref:Uncharacterized protein n=1 Tax=Diatrype stigma TaxID=117547 RepID=A0AAN9US50_9PEZI
MVVLAAPGATNFIRRFCRGSPGVRQAGLLPKPHLRRRGRLHLYRGPARRVPRRTFSPAPSVLRNEAGKGTSVVTELMHVYFPASAETGTIEKDSQQFLEALAAEGLMARRPRDGFWKTL